LNQRGSLHEHANVCNRIFPALVAVKRQTRR
jgi:hypothetical protein